MEILYLMKENMVGLILVKTFRCLKLFILSIWSTDLHNMY